MAAVATVWMTSVRCEYETTFRLHVDVHLGDGNASEWHCALSMARRRHMLRLGEQLITVVMADGFIALQYNS